MNLKDKANWNTDIRNLGFNKELLYHTTNLKMSHIQQKTSLDDLSSFLNFNNNDQSILANNKSYNEEDSREKKETYINQFGE